MLELMAALAHGLQELVENLVEELLALHVAQSTTLIVGFQLIQILVFRPELSKVGIRREGIEIGEHGIALHMSWVVQVHVCGVGIHGAHFLPHFVCRVAQVDAVAQRFRHLLFTVGAGQTACRLVLGQHDVGLYQHLGIGAVEAAHQLARHLEHRLLVFSGRYGGSLEERDVGSLTDRIAEKS